MIFLKSVMTFQRLGYGTDYMLSKIMEALWQVRMGRQIRIILNPFLVFCFCDLLGISFKFRSGGETLNQCILCQILVNMGPKK